MISFKLFVEAIHRAVIEAADVLAKRNEELFDKYFYKSTTPAGKSVLNPKMINLEYPMLNSEGQVVKGEVLVPLITVVPVNASKIEKATLTAEFKLDVVDEEVQIHFSESARSEHDVTCGKLEMVISPQELPKGLELLVNGYNNILKRQIS